MSGTDGEKPLAGRIALVTGATRGLGFASAELLGSAGAQVIAVGRTQSALEALDDAIRSRGGPAATLVPIDLADGAAIDRLGGAIFQRHGRLDILVHAAAMLGKLRPVAHVPPDLWERLMQVNVTSVWRLIRSLEPLLRASDRGRAIFVTCEAAARPTAFWGAYAAGKAAMEALVRAWADETDVSPLRAALVDPGPMRTRLRAEAFPGEPADGVADPADVASMILELCLRDAGAPDAVADYRSWRAAQADRLETT